MKPGILVVAVFVMVGTCLAGQPRPRENKFMKMEAAGLTMSRLPSGAGALAYGFMFALKQPIKIERVRVEDITDRQPVLLVDDRAPKIAKSRWTGDSRVRPLTPEHYPWMFDGKTTKKLFRITVTSSDQGEITLEQPATYEASSKRLMLQVAPKLKKSEE